MKVRVYDADQVTTRGDEEEPQAGGLTAADVDAIWGAVVRLYQTGLQPAIALCLRRRGRLMIDRAIGHARGNAPRAPPGARTRRSGGRRGPIRWAPRTCATRCGRRGSAPPRKMP